MVNILALATCMLATGIYSSPAPLAKVATTPSVGEPTPPRKYIGCSLGEMQRKAGCHCPPADAHRPVTEDGFLRPKCADQSDCFSWALDQCKHAKDSGLLIKSYCLDEFCYALCPPALITSGVAPWPPGGVHEMVDTTKTKSPETGKPPNKTPKWKPPKNPTDTLSLPYPLPTVFPPTKSRKPKPSKTSTPRANTSDTPLKMATSVFSSSDDSYTTNPDAQLTVLPGTGRN